MPTFFQIRTYLAYWLEAVDAHSLHSPFLFDFYTKILKQKDTTDYTVIENLRTKLRRDNRTISYQDQGAGAVHQNKLQRNVSEIARRSLTSKKFAALYNRIIQYIDGTHILELGSSLGITTLYLSVKKNTQVVTFEGASPIADIARLTFEFAQANNIILIEGNIDNTLPAYLQNAIKKIDVAFIDANHRYEPTKRYFDLMLNKTHEKSILIFDDIHYSPEMHKAWQEIKNHQRVYASIDLYRCGLVFFDPSLNKQHVVLQFND